MNPPDHDEPSRAAARADILTDVAGLFASALAMQAWGRLVVELVETKGATEQETMLRVADVIVDEVLDEALVEAAFGAPEAGAIMPTVAVAIDALCALEGLDAAALGGGTFVRTDEAGRLEFLPGRVRAPSRSLDARREQLGAELDRRAQRLRDRYGLGRGADLDIDLSGGTVAFTTPAGERVVASHSVIGSFVWDKRGWAWGAQNPSLDGEVRARSSALLDRVVDRTLWEITTPGFQCDEATVWLLAALVVVDNELAGATRIDLGDDGFLLLGLSEPKVVASS
jgi:hypothetical protein